MVPGVGQRRGSYELLARSGPLRSTAVSSLHGPTATAAGRGWPFAMVLAPVPFKFASTIVRKVVQYRWLLSVCATTRPSRGALAGERPRLLSAHEGRG